MNKLNKHTDLVTVNCDSYNLPIQPLIDDNNEEYYYLKELMNKTKKDKNFDNYDYVVSIVNGISIGITFEDVYYVAIYHKGLLSFGMN
jgi:hypothetical protein